MNPTGNPHHRPQEATMTPTGLVPARSRIALPPLLAAALLCLAPALRAQAPDPVDVPAARAALADALAAGDYETALARAGEIAFQEQTEYLEALHAVLRIRCLQGETEKAYQALEELLDAGWWDHRRLYQDDDLALINKEERFRAAVRKAWSKQYITMLERESRDAMQKPDEIMAALAFRPGERVADVGAGSGYFTVRIARAIGPQGRVLATDIRQEMLDYIADRIEVEQLDNVDLLRVEPDDPRLPPGGVDTIFMADVFHYIADRVAYARKLREALAPGGRLVVIDFRYDPDAEREFAPPPAQQVRRQDLDRDLAEAGLAVAASYDFLPEQYFVVYRAD
jgi:ubiquinone/menaquinone biosynthesis C-methylase UbiE